MTSKSLAQQLEDYTASISKFETKRDYISLSHIAQPEEEIISQFLHGFTDSHEIRLRCYKGYQMERDFLERIQRVLGLNPMVELEVSAFDGLVQGHPDFEFMNSPGDCKSVPLDKHLPENKLPRKVYWQMQAYMKYLRSDRALVLYESRETGRIRDYWIRSNFSIQQEIEQKLKRVVEVVKRKMAPNQFQELEKEYRNGC